MRIWSAGLCLLLWLCCPDWAEAGSAKIIKVLTHYLDQDGRHSLSPSLYERDAYQAWLRKNPEERSALRFDVQWKAKRVGPERLRLRLELRSSGRDAADPIVLERAVLPPRLFSRWSSLLLDEAEFATFGQLIAWRASLWRGDEFLAEQKSFLW